MIILPKHILTGQIVPLWHIINNKRLFVNGQVEDIHDTYGGSKYIIVNSEAILLDNIIVGSISIRDVLYEGDSQ